MFLLQGAPPFPELEPSETFLHTLANYKLKRPPSCGGALWVKSVVTDTLYMSISLSHGQICTFTSDLKTATEQGKQRLWPARLLNELVISPAGLTSWNTAACGILRTAQLILLSSDCWSRTSTWLTLNPSVQHSTWTFLNTEGRQEFLLECLVCIQGCI